MNFQSLLTADNIILAIFVSFLLIIIYFKRKNIVIQKLIFPILYISMLKTQLGINAMDSLARKLRKPLKFLADFGIVIGFLGMILIAFMLAYSIYAITTNPKAEDVGAGIVAPIKAKGFFYVPALFFIICIFIIASIHEFSHGVIARIYNLKIKSSGFAFLHLLVPIIPMAFVEPDEKELAKRPIREQLGIFAAGPFSNILLAFVVLGLLIGLSYIISPYVDSIIVNDGVLVAKLVNDSKYPAELAGIKPNEVITKIDSTKIITKEDFNKFMKTKKPGDTISIITGNGTYATTLAARPETENKFAKPKESKPYLGVYAAQSSHISETATSFDKNFAIPAIGWVGELFYWLFVLNIGIGLFNLVPLGPIDGGRMLKVVLDKKFKQQTAAKLFKWISIFFLGIIIINVVIGFVR